VRYAVVGAGITGLAAAYELAQLVPGEDVTVYDPAPPGGKLRTTRFAGRLVDEGADAFLARVPWGRDLCDQLGIGDELVSPANGTAYVAGGTDLHRLPAGLVLGVPTDAEALRGSSLVPPSAVDRVAAEPSLAGLPLADGHDISVGALIRERFGDDVLERLVDPLIGGINAGVSDRLSVRAAAPQIAEAASRATSLVEGLRTAPASAAPGAPVFWTHPGGMGVLVDRLVAALLAAGVRIDATLVDDLASIDADGVVLTTPARATASLVEQGGADEAARLLRTIGHASPVLVTIALDRADVRHPLDASGLLVPRVERRFLTACSFSTTKWAHLAEVDDATVVLRASAGRHGDERAIEADDESVVAGVLNDLDDLIGLDGEPTEVRVSRWRDGFPQYEPGHLDRVAAIEADLAAALPFVRVAGASYRGIGVPACIRQGREAARSLAR
jgi:oxygen-dependent protoporphyrinogen oxidase